MSSGTGPTTGSPAEPTSSTPQPSTATPPQPLYGGTSARRLTIRDLAAAKVRGERWPMLTAYDQYSAAIFDQAGIPVLLVGDSAGNNVLGYENTVPVTVDELVPFVRAVVGATKRALVVADFPFGSYEASPQQALETGVRFLKEGGAQAVKMEGGRRVAPQVEALVSAGVPVMGHIGLTPQSVNVLGGYRVQGRGEAGEQLLRDAKELEHAGAFAVVLEVVPADLARRVTETLTIPTIGIGAGNGTDAQVLVWPDLLGLNPKPPKFVQPYADLRSVMSDAVHRWADDVVSGTFPDEDHSFS
jgi:3-methyl-2-oxobutanoate hydroxymethyltransferase